MEKEAENKMEFFGGLMSAFKEGRQVDIWLQAGDQSDAIPAHKLILVARSKVFRKILELDDCKGSSMSSKETVTLSEMTRDELETFLDFLYKGSLPDAKLVHHLRSLYLSAHKYEIPYLQDLCRNELISTINSSNVFDSLELAKIYSDKILEDAVSRFIQSHMKEVAFSREFMSFVESNPALAVDTIRGHLVGISVSKICNLPEPISSRENFASAIRQIIMSSYGSRAGLKAKQSKQVVCGPLDPCLRLSYDRPESISSRERIANAIRESFKEISLNPPNYEQLLEQSRP